nr:tetratricopeptide repeat protein [Deinobacterium chartae]
MLPALLLSLPALAQTALPDDLQFPRTLVEEGNTALAKLRLNDYLKRHPGHRSATLLLARAYLLEGEPERAQAQLQTLGSPRNDPEYSWVAGLVSAELGKNELALAQLRIAAIQGDDYRYAMDWGELAWRLGRLDLATQAYGRAQQLAPEEPWPRLNAAMIAYAQERYPQAIMALRAAAAELDRQKMPASHPAYPELYFWLGQSLEASGDRAAARSAYLEALRYDPNYSSARRALEALR